MTRALVVTSLICLLILTAGCAGRRAFQSGEELVKQGQYDAAVAHFAQAVSENPGSQEYRMRLLDTRHRAALERQKSGRRLAAQGDYPAAAFELRQAVSLDPSLASASQDLREVQEKIRAEELIRDAEQFLRGRKYPQARNALQEAQQLSPGHPKAEELTIRVQEQRRTLMFDGFELDVASDEPITLKFRDADVREVFNILSKLSGINFIFDDDLRAQRVSVFLERATFGQAMELILRMNNLGSRVLNPKTIIIYPRTREKDRQYQDQIIQTFYLSNIDAKRAVNMLRTMLQLRRIYVHEELNALVIRDTPEAIKLSQQILEAADRTDSEVVFDLELVEVNHRDDLDFGPQLNTYSIGAGMAQGGRVVGSTLSAGMNVQTGNLLSGLSNLTAVYTLPNATFEFLKTRADSEILANPKIRVRNREKSAVHVGEREPVITVTTTGETITDNVQYVDVGVKLRVEPTVQLDNTVITRLDLEVSSVTERTTTASGTVALRISTTNAQTALTLRDGERTIIGGLIRDDNSTTRTSIPIIGDIPIIGPLLTSHTKRDRKREILLSITPHIVRNVDLPRADVASIWSGGEEDLKAGPNFAAFLFEPILEQPPTPPVPGTPATAVPPSSSALPDETTVEVAPDEWFDTDPEFPVREPSPAAPWAAEDFPPAPIDTPARPGTAAQPLPLLGAPAVVGDPRIRLQGGGTVSPGGEFVIDVMVESVRDLYSAPLFVNFDPKVIEFIRAEEGNFLRTPGQTTVFSTSVDSQTGRLIIGYKQGVGGKGASGDGHLFRLHFRGKAPGTAVVELDRINFRDPSGIRLPINRTETTIEVR